MGASPNLKRHHLLGFAGWFLARHEFHQVPHTQVHALQQWNPRHHPLAKIEQLTHRPGVQEQAEQEHRPDATSNAKTWQVPGIRNEPADQATEKALCSEREPIHQIQRNRGRQRGNQPLQENIADLAHFQAPPVTSRPNTARNRRRTLSKFH